MLNVRIHDRRITARREYKVNYRTAEIPVAVCQQCCKESKHVPCPHCGNAAFDVVQRSLPDNGALISCGLNVGYGSDEVTPEQLAYLIETGQVQEIPEAQKGHGGCQSRCVLRGDACCQW